MTDSFDKTTQKRKDMDKLEKDREEAAERKAKGLPPLEEENKEGEKTEEKKEL